MRFAVVGHRGAIAEAPENTVSSFQRAEEIGVDEIETDVRISCDGQLFMLHDDDLNRVADTASDEAFPPAADLPWSTISSIDLGGGEHVPTLEQMYEATTVQIQLEIKALGAIGPILQFLAEHRDLADRTILSSFSIEAMVRVAAEAPDIRRGVIIPGWRHAADHPDSVAGLIRQTGSERIHCRWDGLTAAAVDQVHELGCEIHGWPGRTEEDYETATTVGVDGMCSDDPRGLTHWLEERKLRPVTRRLAT
jgi:glycerophosphoryl diester phosphodiesterase